MPGFLRDSLTIAAKDLRSELRTKEALNASVSFSLVILLLFSFAFDPSADQTREFSGGLLWLVFAFAGALILNRSFARELENDCLDALLAAPISGAALFLGKAWANLVLLLAVEFMSLPVFGIFYNVRWTAQLPALVLVLVLGTWGLTVIGTMFSALTVNLRLREIQGPAELAPVEASIGRKAKPASDNPLRALPRQPGCWLDDERGQPQPWLEARSPDAAA